MTIETQPWDAADHLDGKLERPLGEQHPDSRGREHREPSLRRAAALPLQRVDVGDPDALAAEANVSPSITRTAAGSPVSMAARAGQAAEALVATA